MKILNNRSFNNPIFIFLIIAFCLVLFIHPWAGKYYNNLISWDKVGYYLYLPIAFIYKDWLHLNFITDYFNQYQPSSYWYQTITLPDGNQVISYPIGIALVQIPTFILGYISALLLGYKLDGFSEPFVFWSYMSGLVFGLAGIYYSYKSLCYFFSTKLSYTVVLILFAGTNIFYYCFWDTIMPHSYLFGLYSIVIYNTIRWHEAPKFIRLLKIGISIGLMVSMRATEVIVVIIPLLWGVSSWDTLKSKLLLLNQYKLQLTVCILIGSIPFVLQMIYWKATTGHFIFNPYAYFNLGFSWTKPHFAHFFLSFRKGFLIYAPLMILAAAGFIILIKDSKYKDFVWGFILFSIINIYILSSWDVWWYGGSYGQRSMIQSYAVFLFPMAALLHWVHGKRFSYVIYGFIALCILLNSSFTYQYAAERMNSDGITKGMFKESLLNPNFSKIKSKDSVNNELWSNDFIKSKSLLYAYDFRKDSTLELDSLGQAVVIMPNSFMTIYEPSTDSIIKNRSKWIRCSFDMKHTDTAPFYLNSLTVVAETKGYEVDTRSWVGKSFHHLYKNEKDYNQWKKCEADFEVPATFRDCDKLKFYFWMNGNESALIKNIKIYEIELND